MSDNGLHSAYCEPRYGEGRKPVKVIGPDPDWPLFLLVLDDGRIVSVHRDSVRWFFVTDSAGSRSPCRLNGHANPTQSE